MCVRSTINPPVTMPAHRYVRIARRPVLGGRRGYWESRSKEFDMSGFYIEDLYVYRVPKFRWHDKLTNPPTIPETSPIIRTAALSPAIARAGGGGGEVGMPDPENTMVTIPTPITPIVTPIGRLEFADLALVRENLKVTLAAVEAQLETMKPTQEQLEYVRKVIQ